MGISRGRYAIEQLCWDGARGVSGGSVANWGCEHIDALSLYGLAVVCSRRDCIVRSLTMNIHNHFR